MHVLLQRNYQPIVAVVGRNQLGNAKPVLHRYQHQFALLMAK
jgi:hypothetical protein